MKRHSVKIAASTPTSTTSDSQAALLPSASSPQPQLTASSAAIAAARAAAVAAASSQKRATTAPMQVAVKAAAADVTRQAMINWAQRDPNAEEAAQPRAQHSTDGIAQPSAALQPRHDAQTDAAGVAASTARPSQGPMSILQEEAAWEEEDQELQLGQEVARSNAPASNVTDATVNLSAKTGLAGLASAARM